VAFHPVDHAVHRGELLGTQLLQLHAVIVGSPREKREEVRFSEV
jgi:hypothetical protein